MVIKAIHIFIVHRIVQEYLLSFILRSEIKVTGTLEQKNSRLNSLSRVAQLANGQPRFKPKTFDNILIKIFYPVNHECLLPSFATPCSKWPSHRTSKTLGERSGNFSVKKQRAKVWGWPRLWLPNPTLYSKSPSREYINKWMCYNKTLFTNIEGGLDSEHRSQVTNCSPQNGMNLHGDLWCIYICSLW